jgi:uncharacterized membrane protein YraQ (UPF0718 family)
LEHDLMATSLIAMGVIASILLAIALSRRPEGIPLALTDMRKQIAMFAMRLPPALLAAAFLSLIVPTDLVAPYIGPESGWQGIFIATAFGAFIPGGPILTFPMALVVWRAGAGDAQMVALLASWSVFAMHRIISYELPMLGGRFVMLRMASTWMLPLLAGLLALAVIAIQAP